MPLLEPRQVFRDAADESSAGRFGLTLFLVSIGILFVSAVIACIAIRVRLAEEGAWPRELPGVPLGALASTAILVLSAWPAESARRALRRDPSAAVATRLRGAAALGVVFLGAQALAWRAWSSAIEPLAAATADAQLATSGFYLLTGLHAAHVLGGLVAFEWGVRRGGRAAAGACVYWHFLGGAWLLLLAVLAVLMAPSA